jgi:nicotinate-nucleotide adenylyltransferase
MRQVLPRHAPGLRIGLFGGSFNPAHAGHRLASLIALRRLRLDCIWWLVSPGNPLKSWHDLPSLDSRMAKARALAKHPRLIVTGLEAAIGTRYTFDTIDHLTRRCPGVKFVWIMGADNLSGFHRWQHWREIVTKIPIAVIDRPGATLKAANSRAGTVLSRWRLDERDAALLPDAKPPAFIFVHGPRSTLSSTALRQRGMD